MGKNERKCRYARCPHQGLVDIRHDQYIKIDRCYYHTKCYSKMQKELANQRCIEYICKQWVLYVSHTVNADQLKSCLRDLIQQGYSADYLVFAFDYIVGHRLNLNYPQGFKYFVAKSEIQKAYSTKTKHTSNESNGSNNQVIEPTFEFKPKPTGFHQILGGKK